MTLLAWTARIAIAILAGYVLYGLGPVILNEWQSMDACPKLGVLPACYLVGLCYTAMGFAAVAAPRKLTWMFAAGWLPVLGLAVTGSALELLGRSTCPMTSSGFPMCYYSLAVALILIPAFILARANNRRAT